MRKKIKKYNTGVQKVKGYVEENEEPLGMLSQGVGLGLTALTQSKASSKYTSQLKDPTANTGKAIGQGAGQALNLIAPGLGTIAAPILGAVGGAIQTGLQKKKLDGIIDQTVKKETNAAYNSSLTSNNVVQANQFKKGGKGLGSKLIEIEGDKAPEIHTDSNFNLKTLGTTPHEQGGTKTVAQEGDVVFPTQNDPAKYNKIMKAIKEKDLPTLKKEQSKLPTDSSKKYAKGSKKVDPPTKEERDALEKLLDNTVLGDFKRAADKLMYETLPKEYKELADKSNPTSDKPGRGVALLAAEKAANKLTSVTGKAGERDRKSASKNKGVFAQPSKLLDDRLTNRTSNATVGSGVIDIPAPPARVSRSLTPAEKSTGGTKSTAKPIIKSGGNGKTPKKVVNEKPLAKPIIGSNLGADLTGIDDPTLLGEEARAKYEAGIKSGKYKPAITPEEFMKQQEPPKDQDGKVKVGYKANSNSAMELAPIAYNLGQGLFGKAEQVDRQFLTPETERYEDRSANSRRASNTMYQAQKSNARNASGGSLGNMRANQQVAANEEAARQVGINDQEINRQDQINSRNTQMRNNAQGVNLQLKNQYDEIDAANRAAKTNMLQAGLTGLSDIASRNILNANRVDAQNRELGAFAANSNYLPEYDKNGVATGKFVFNEARIASPTQKADLKLQEEQIKQAKANKATSKPGSRTEAYRYFRRGLRLD